MDRIYVAVRSRPLSQEDSKNSPWRLSGNSISLSNSPTKFEFDRIFGDDCRTVDVYEARTKEIVSSAVRGFNGTVFAYGQTNSGKTYTMRGSATEPGIIPLAVLDLFQSIQEDLDREFLVRMSYMEIYNEEINDLLAPEHRRLQVHENLERGIYVAGLKEEIVSCAEQVLELMEFGESHRHIGQTNMNLYSSRSHTIFRMIIESRERVEDSEMADSCDAVRVSVLNLVDLAGSERAAKTGAEGMRLKEGSHINKSLMTLGTVIKKLSEGVESQGGHVPYRDSKLTRILQPALGGNANTSIICNITLAQIHTDETKSSLQFASRALRVTNCACVNEILTDAALLRRQRKEIEELRAKLMSSHSEHWEEEILNLRNTLLQSELEKERIALELEEEKKAKAHREQRLLEQAKKIANLSSLVLCSERENKDKPLSKNKRRVTWCPGPLSELLSDKVSSPESAATSSKPVQHNQSTNLLVPFQELMHEDNVEDANNNTCSTNNYDCEEFSFPDAHALLRVTSRRKVHSKSTGMVMENSLHEKKSEQADQRTDLKFRENDVHTCTPRQYPATSGFEICGSASRGDKKLTSRETEAILVIKQLEDQIKSLEMEKSSMQQHLDNVLELATEQNASFREKIERELNLDLSVKMSSEVQDIAAQFENFQNFVGEVLFTVEGLLQNFSVVSGTIAEIKSFANQDSTLLESLINGHEKLRIGMLTRFAELEQEKNILQEQSVDYQRQIEEITADLENNKAMAEISLQHELEKEELLSLVLNLQKELSSLSSSSLMREKESLRKELDKTKIKLKETDSKLKNAIQDKIKLEGEKAQAEREIKHLQNQKNSLERDMLKRDSLIGKRCESKPMDSARPKGLPSVAEHSLQEYYQNLEAQALEMEAVIASLQQALSSAIEEKEESLNNNENLKLEVIALADKLNAAELDLTSLQEEAQRLLDSNSLCNELEASINSISKEKEEMAMQLTDALLEFEAEKSLWLLKDKSLTEANECIKAQKEEILKLSESLSKARHELSIHEEQCRALRENLTLVKQNDPHKKECRTLRTSESPQLVSESKIDSCGFAYYENQVKESILLAAEYDHACQQEKMRHQRCNPSREGDMASSSETNIDLTTDILNEYQNIKQQLLVVMKERDSLLAKSEELGRVAAELDVRNKYNDEKLAKAGAETEEMSKRICKIQTDVHTEGLRNNKETTKLKMQLRHTQAKLDAYRGRYMELSNEMDLMNSKYEQASTKLKKQLASYGVEILNLKKQLSARG